MPLCKSFPRQAGQAVQRVTSVKARSAAPLRDPTSAPAPNAGPPQPRRLIKDFEREARTDGLPADDLAARKRALVAELNGLITAKKQAAGALDARRELVADGRANKAGAEIVPGGARGPPRSRRKTRLPERAPAARQRPQRFAHAPAVQAPDDAAARARSGSRASLPALCAPGVSSYASRGLRRPPAQRGGLEQGAARPALQA